MLLNGFSRSWTRSVRGRRRWCWQPRSAYSACSSGSTGWIRRRTICGMTPRRCDALRRSLSSTIAFASIQAYGLRSGAFELPQSLMVRSMTIPSRKTAGLTPAQVTLAIVRSACAEAPTVGITSDLATRDLVTARGRVVNLDGAPLDSFRVVASVPDSTWFDTVVSFITSTSGNYSLRRRRVDTGRADSGLVTVTATSIKGGDRTTDGMYPTGWETVWLPFVAESDRVTSPSRDLIVPFRRS